jgi:hypothetical protein
VWAKYPKGRSGGMYVRAMGVLLPAVVLYLVAAWLLK